MQIGTRCVGQRILEKLSPVDGSRALVESLIQNVLNVVICKSRCKLPC